MDPPQINYINHNSILIINPKGKIRQLFTPFKVQLINDTSILKKSSWVVVEEIRQHPKHLLIYRVINHWWPYFIFKLDVRF